MFFNHHIKVNLYFLTEKGHHMSKIRKTKDKLEIEIRGAPEIFDAFDSEEGNVEEELGEEDAPVLELLEEEIIEKKDVLATKEELLNILSKIESTTRNKDRAGMIDRLNNFLMYPETIQALKDIAINDKYPLCRAKAVSFLSEFIRDDEVKDLVIRSLKDSSQKVRQWSVWTLRELIDEEEIQDVLIRHLRHYERSKSIKLWIVRTLSDRIENTNVIDVYLQTLKKRPNKEMRKLILYYIIQIRNNSDIIYFLSTYVHEETDEEIRLQIVKALLEINNSDTNYALQKLKRNERSQEILSLLPR